MKKLIALLLGVCVIFTCASCKPTSTSDNDSSVIDEVLTNEHILHYGETDYSIVLPEKSNYYEEMAASELLVLFNEATGIMLDVIKDDTLVHSDSAKYFSIGNTSLLESSDIVVAEEAKGKNSYQITTKGNTIYFIGGKEYGVLYSIYEFLFRTLNFEQFSEDCYSLDKAVIDIPLYNYSVVDSPSFRDHQVFTGYLQRNLGVLHRMRGGMPFANSQMTVEGKDDHNTLVFIKKSEHLDAHEKWFSYPEQNQLCYVAQGDAEEYELLVNTMVESLKETIMQPYNVGKKVLGIGNMDNKSCCNCKKCVELREEYGCNTAQMIWFLNDVDEKLQDWFKNDEEGKKYYQEDFCLQTTFYEEYTKAPAKYNETKDSWEPMDDSVVFNKTVRPMIAPIAADFQRPITDPVNKIYYDAILQLRAVSQQFAVFWYCTNFYMFMVPFDNFNAMQSSYQTLAELGCTKFVDETQNGNNGGMTGFHIFKTYLSTALAWDVYADQAALTDRFFKAYFMDAAEDMRMFYDSYRDFSQFQMNVLCPNMGSIYFLIDKKEYWPKAVIDEWQGYVETAMNKIEKYKDADPKTYEMLYKHISMERVFLDYIYLHYYKTNLGVNYNFYAERFINDFRLNNITCTREGKYYLEDFAQKLISD